MQAVGDVKLVTGDRQQHIRHTAGLQLHVVQAWCLASLHAYEFSSSCCSCCYVAAVVDCPSPQPLLPLTQLQVLQMNAATTPAAGLAQLAAHLTRLTCVRLCYERDPGVIAAAAGGWAALPLLRLELRVYPGPVTAGAIQALAQLRGLTHLTIQVLGSSCSRRQRSSCRPWRGGTSSSSSSLCIRPV